MIADFFAIRVVHIASVRVMSSGADPLVCLDARDRQYPGRSLYRQRICHAPLAAFPPYSLVFFPREEERQIYFSTYFLC